MKQEEIIIGNQYLFVNNGQREDKAAFHNTLATVISRVKGKSNTKAFHRNRRAKKPDRFLLDIGIYANASNLKPITTNESTNTVQS